MAFANGDAFTASLTSDQINSVWSREYNKYKVDVPHVLVYYPVFSVKTRSLILTGH